jgi:ABC-2 type transport system ATP-binding protein
MLEAANLRKSFGTLVAVDDVSLRLENGETLGLLGPNGAGKTTTVSILCGLTTPDRGTVSIDGWPLGGDTSPGKRKIGLVPQDIALYEELSARDNLQFFGALYGLAGAELEAALASTLELVGLADRIVIIDHGKVIASDTVAGLTRAGGTLESVFLTLTGRSLRD